MREGHHTTDMKEAKGKHQNMKEKRKQMHDIEMNHHNTDTTDTRKTHQVIELIEMKNEQHQ